MTHVKNNAIALGVHILLCGCLYLVYIYFGDVYPKITFYSCPIIGILADIACGFFLLKPVDKHCALSLISVPIAIVTLLFSLSFCNQDYILLACFHPLGMIPMGLANRGIPNLPFLLYVVMLFFPPLLMWAGMVLKKKFRKTNAKKCKTI